MMRTTCSPKGRPPASGGGQAAATGRPNRIGSAPVSWKKNGSVQRLPEEQAHSTLLTARAAAQAEARQFELARQPGQLHPAAGPPSSGVVTALRMKQAEVVAAGQPVITLANEGKAGNRGGHSREPAGRVQGRTLQGRAGQWRRSAILRSSCAELSAQASAQTRTYRARLKPVVAQSTAAGATTLIAERTDGGTRVATLPRRPLTQEQGRRPWDGATQDGKGNTGAVQAGQGSPSRAIAAAGARLPSRRGSRPRRHRRGCRRWRQGWSPCPHRIPF